MNVCAKRNLTHVRSSKINYFWAWPASECIQWCCVVIVYTGSIHLPQIFFWPNCSVSSCDHHRLLSKRESTLIWAVVTVKSVASHKCSPAYQRAVVGAFVCYFVMPGAHIADSRPFTTDCIRFSIGPGLTMVGSLYNFVVGWHSAHMCDSKNSNRSIDQTGHVQPPPRQSTAFIMHVVQLPANWASVGPKIPTCWTCWNFLTWADWARLDNRVRYRK